MRQTVVSFLNALTDNPNLRQTAQQTYRSAGLEGLVALGEKEGYSFTSSDLESIISPSELSPGAQGTSIGWG